MIGEPPSLAGGVQVRSISDAEAGVAVRPVGRDGTAGDGVVVVVVVEVVVVVVELMVVVEVTQFMTAVNWVSLVTETALGLPVLPLSSQWSKEQEPNPLTRRLYDWPLLRVNVAGVNPLATVTPFWDSTVL